MAKLVQGVLGGFTGTVGTVIGMCKKNGDDVIIAKSKKKRTSSTEGQVNQRTKFGLTTGFMQALNPLVKVGCKTAAGNDMSAYNYACKHLMTNAIVGTSPDFEIDYSQVLVSDGQLSQPTNASAQLVNGVVNFKWDDNTGDCTGAGTDKVVLVVYNVTNLEVSYKITAETRSTKAGTLNIPNSSEGDQLVFYMFLQSATDPYLVTTSQYLGTATV